MLIYGNINIIHLPMWEHSVFINQGASATIGLNL